MTQIDWSKAPKEATHCTPARSEDTRPCFWRVVDGNAVEVWAMSDCYQHIHDHFTYSSSGCQAYQHHRSIARPIGWNGSGLPPVGALVEDRSVLGAPVYIAEVVAVEDWLVALKRPGSLKVVDIHGIRPIRTPAQLAAEEREERLIAMSHAYQDATGRSPDSYIKEAFRALDAEGYRKVEVKP